MEKSVRKGLHERSSSKNNELPVLSAGYSGGQVSEKDYHHPSGVSTRPPTTPTKSKNVTKPRTPNTPSSLASSSISFSSLPPIPPLHINKIPPLSVKKQQKKPGTPTSPRKTGLEEYFYAPAQERRPSIYIDSETRSASNSTTSSSSDIGHLPLGPRPLPNPAKPILKKAKQLPPYTVEDYEEKRSSWIERNSEQAQIYARMNGRSLRIVRDDEDEHSSDTSFVGPSRQTSPILSPPTLLPPSSPRLLDPAYIPGSPTKQPASRSNSLLRTSSLLRPSSSKGIPSWARYFYSRGEDLVPMDEEAAPAASSDSLAITPLPPAHHGQHPHTYGPRNRNDPEVLTQWSYPHLDRAAYPLSKTENPKNRQVIMFCLGFLLPILWIVAAFLPLPGPKPAWTPGRVPRSEAGADVEKTLQNCSVEHERFYRYSKFWRKVNRAMSVVGCLIIGATIALVVVATRS